MARHSVRAALVVAALAALVGTAAPASADPTGAGLVSQKVTGPTTLDIVVHSAAMKRDIPLSVLKPRDASAPRGVLYLLNGAGGGEDSATWQRRTDVVDFFAKKNVWVITPNKGEYTYYTDWVRPDKKLGINKWSTFLGKELPGIIDASFNTSGKNAIAGISTSATAVLNLAIDHPAVFGAIGAYSGCASTSTTAGMTFVRLVVEGRGGADARNMWGPFYDGGWEANDPVLRAAGLRGKQIYLSSASGLPGPYDTPADVPQADAMFDRLVLGGGIEAVTRYCTEQMATRLAGLGIPATIDRPAVGTHSWGYWQDQLHKSWPLLQRVIGG